MEKLFLHVCCGPCAAFPLEWFREQRETSLELWFYNPNIHPLSEFLRRRDTLAYLAMRHGLNVDFSPAYDYEKFMALAVRDGEVLPEPERCRHCYALRFAAAAKEAAARGHGRFSTTLSFSKRQKHDLILEEGHKAGEKHGVEFHYIDFRPHWQRGHELAKEYGLYKQNYCGCLFSQRG